MQFSTLLTATALATTASAGYNLQTDFFAGNFFDNFDFQTFDDPTHGFVNYVSSDVATSSGLAKMDGGNAYIGVDSTNVASGRGRDSVRLSSKQQFNRGLLVIDVAHMPEGDATWPAFWTVGDGWPNSGEIDIIEGVNTQSTNFMTLHLGESCAVQGAQKATLPVFSTDCYAYDNNNEGCSFHDDDTASYGSGLNSAGGATFAMEWTDNTVSIWKWTGSNANALVSNPDPSTWGTPRAQWVTESNGCNLGQDLKNHNIVFDTTFCGDWAGAAFNGGPAECINHVTNNPGSFSNAYWSVRALKLFSTDGQASAPVSDSPPPPPPSATTTAVSSTSSPPAETTTDSPPPPPVASSSVQPTSNSPPAISSSDVPLSTSTSTTEVAPQPTNTGAAPPPPPPPASSTTSPAPVVTATTSQVGGRPTGRPHRTRTWTRRPRTSATNVAAVPANTYVATPPATSSHVPWSVVAEQNGNIGEIQEPPSRRNYHRGQHARHAARLRA